MGKVPLMKNSEFVVREDKVLVYILAFLFFALFVYGLVDAIKNRFINIDYADFIFMLALIPVIFLMSKARNNRVYIRINKTGIYQGAQLITSWSNFLNAYVSQKQVVISIQDNFILVVEYRKDISEKGFRRSIPLTNTQNKSEEEVLEAVQFFWKEYRNDASRDY